VKVFINSASLISAAGLGLEEHLQALKHGHSCIQYNDGSDLGGRIQSKHESLLGALRKRQKHGEHADRGVLLGVVAAEAAMQGDQVDREQLAVVVGSSRGATNSWEASYEQFLESGDVGVTTSPQTTPGTFASSIANAVGAQGPAQFVSAACTSGLVALATGWSHLISGVASNVLVNAAESAMTPFSYKMFERAKILAKSPSILFPMRPFHPGRTGMVPGEGAASMLLQSRPTANTLARISGVGLATESSTLTGIDKQGKGLSLAIKRALATSQLYPSDIDLIVAHGAGTRLGDEAELESYRHLFDMGLPPLTCHKWLTGHTLGASGLISAALGMSHLNSLEVPKLPYFDNENESPAFGGRLQQCSHVLVCSLGFGGQAAAVILSTP
jgi:3-oxoacyl-(acyl-carrier-protein) synthase